MVAFIVKVRVPLGAVLPACTVSVEEPEVVTEVGLKMAVVFGGKPLTLSTVVGPGLAVIVTV